MSTAGTATTDGRLRVFVSYARADRPLGQSVRELLARGGHRRVFSTDMLSAGGNWQARLREEMVASDVVVVLLSPAAVDSSWVLQELGGAWALEKPIVAISSDPALLARIPISWAEHTVITPAALEEPGMLDRLLARHERHRATDTGSGASAN